MPSPPKPEPLDPEEDHLNNVMAAGGLWMVLSMFRGQWEHPLLSAEPVFENGVATNRVVVKFHFLKSPYQLTVERIDEDDEPF